MAVNPNISNSSIVRAIALSPVFKFNDSTDGATNKIAVQNRVKKMSQAERKELMGELDHVIGNLDKAPIAPSLKERGLCVLLLSDDGKIASKSCFLVSFVCGFLNLIHARTSSDAVMQKLEETKNVLGTKSIVPDALDVKGELDAEIKRLEQEIQAQAPAKGEVRALIKLINEIRPTVLKDLREASWDKIGTFVDLEGSLVALKQQANATAGVDAVKLINDSIDVIKKLIIKPRDLQGSFNENKWGVIGLISFELRKLEVRLDAHISSIQDEKEKLQERQELVQKRLSKFEENNRKGSERKLFGDSLTQIKDAAKKIKILNEICEAIETLTKRKGSFPALATAIQSINSQLLTSSDDIKNVQNFGQHFALLAQFAAKDPTLDKQKLADVIDLSVLTTNSAHTELHASLPRFKTNPTLNFPNSDDQMKTLINDYVAYWNILFTGLRDGQRRILETEKAKLAPKKAPEPEQKPQAPKPVSPVVVAVPNPAPVAASVPAAALPPLINIPTLGNPKLITIARGLQDVRENEKADHTWYSQVKKQDGLDQVTVEKVYGNFYNIMKSLGKLGAVNEKGESIDPKWGTNVFTTGTSTVVGAPAVARPLLNHYRVQAIVQTLNG